ncbi:cytochrome c [uncultured Oxalicibacterium sp.]|uniref:cytochrome c n=1 Tax=uncultured Oxalicibacterium sp. TaxID=1168540 RepID=UPI0025D2FFFE|nr:cytochrome c [uncultured Oxalicibacterium sp.]
MLSLNLRFILILAIAAFCASSQLAAHAADEPVLELVLPNQQQKLARNNLLRHPEIRTITIDDDPVYHRSMTYRAIPLKAIVRQVSAIDTLQVVATDGFVANIRGELLRAEAEPWIAIEPANAPWPERKPGSGSAGAFYLVWLHPEKAGITSEQWPFQIASLRNVEALTVRYPQLLPKLAATDTRYASVQRGLPLFTTHCASCHRMNGGGDAAIGPDLNLPANPTEYFQESWLRKLIRDPASVRHWAQSSVPGFSEKTLNEDELDDLLAYLQQMAQQRH